MLSSCSFRGEKVYFSATGKGKAVVLLHGFLGSHKVWGYIAKELSKNYRVIVPDLPGHGKSPFHGGIHSMELLADSVKAVLDELKIKKCVITGHSMGGYAGLAFADLYPDHISGLCLFHSTAYADSEDKKHDRLRAIKLVKADKGIYTRNTIKHLFAAKHARRMKTEISFATGIAKSTGKNGIIAALQGMKDRPSRDIILRLVKYPVLMVIGRHDRVLPEKQLLDQAKFLKKGSVLYLENDGHFGFLESPEASLLALRKFLQDCFS